MCPVRAGQAVVDVDVVGSNSEGSKTVPLSGEVLLIRRDARVADLPPTSVAVNAPSPCISSCGSYVHRRAHVPARLPPEAWGAR
jgi:hypothetical protein